MPLSVFIYINLKKNIDMQNFKPEYKQHYDVTLTPSLVEKARKKISKLKHMNLSKLIDNFLLTFTTEKTKK